MHSFNRWANAAVGIDPDEAELHGLLYRGVSYFFIVLGICAMAFGATSWTLHESLTLPAWMSLTGGALVATVVLGIDRLVVSSPIESDSAGAKLKFLLLRGSVSVVLGLYISHGLVLYAYGDTLEARATAAAAQAANDLGGQIREDAPETRQIEEFEATILSLETQNSAMAARADELLQAYTDNTACVGTSGRAADGDFCGSGGVSPALAAAHEDYVRTTLEPVTESNNIEIERLRGEIEGAQLKLDQRIAGVTTTAESETGYAARNRELINLIREDWTLLLLPLFLLVLDSSAALLKASLPRTSMDRASARRAADEAAGAKLKAGHPAWIAAMQKVIENEAEVATARSESRTQIAMRRAAKLSAEPSRLRRATISGLAAVLVCALLIGLLRGLGEDLLVSGDNQGDQSRSDVLIELGGGATLAVPEGAISDNREVKARVTEGASWDGYVAASDAFEIRTDGDVVGNPVLSLRVPEDRREAAQRGDLVVAFESDSEDGWTEVPSTYDPDSGQLSAVMDHFSVWQFWEWDLAGAAENVAQSVGQLVGLRAEAAVCESDIGEPDWFSNGIGIENGAGLVIRSCTQGNEDSNDTLDVQIVNNRPYGMFLSYNGASVRYGWHEEAEEPSDQIRHAIGDQAARREGGLYLPPLGRASVGVSQLPSGSRHTFSIYPTASTLSADIISELFDGVVDNVITAASASKFRDLFVGEVVSKCVLTGGRSAELVRADSVGEAMSWVTQYAIPCAQALLVVTGRTMVAEGADLRDLRRVQDLLKAMASVTQASKVFTLLERMTEIVVDGSFAVDGERIYGFTIVRRSEQPTGGDGPAPPAPTSEPESSTPPAPAPPRTTPPSPVPTESPTGSTPEPLPPTQTPLEVLAYNNYGPVTTPGHEVCRGNPDRSESMPGGIVSQTFTAASNVRITEAVVQIDPAEGLIAKASLLVGGSVVDSAAAEAAGDTTFQFSGVRVAAGTEVTLEIKFEATTGKITTVYSVTGGGGAFAVRNECADGASDYFSDTEGLRAIVRGVGY